MIQKNTKREQFAELIEMLASTFGREADKPLLLGYWLALQDLALPELQEAIRKALQTFNRLPRPSELRELCGVLSGAQQAALAFTDVQKALSDCGYYNSPDFQDRAINATIRALGGWQRICELNEEEFSKWFRKDFERLYVIYAEQGVSEEAGQPLVGYFEAQNRVLGYQRDSRVSIGSCLPAPVLQERIARDQRLALQESRGQGIPRIEIKRP